jgi:hypothetical protein
MGGKERRGEMKVLVACEYSQIVTQAFRAKGHEAYSCDLLPTDGNPDWHYQSDIFHLLHNPLTMWWDLIIAHPPCTRLCNSGVRWLNERNLWEEMRAGALFFKSLLNSNCDRICVENPIPHKYAIEIIGEKYTQVVQPWQFGHSTSKATCLWLKGLPELKPTNIIPKEQRTQDIWLAAPGPNRWKERSKTFTGIAQAMAEQWGSLEANKSVVNLKQGVLL